MAPFHLEFLIVRSVFLHAEDPGLLFNTKSGNYRLSEIKMQMCLFILLSHPHYAPVQLWEAQKIKQVSASSVTHPPRMSARPCVQASVLQAA